MEASVGNPNVSLLPQPAVAAPIEAMRGGGGDSGVSESVSLLPQPAVAAPIEPMRGGGGNENVSLLPQPVVPAPIEAMKGGAQVPILHLQGFKQKLTEELAKPEYVKGLEVSLRKPIVDKYNDYRKKFTWKEEQMPKKGMSLPKLPYTISMDDSKKVYVYFVYDFKHFLEITNEIDKKLLNLPKKTDLLPIFIVVDNTRDLGEFHKIYRKFLQLFVTYQTKYSDDEDKVIENERFKFFFLFDKANKGKLELDWDRGERTASQEFLFAEPDSICITYAVESDSKGVCFLPSNLPFGTSSENQKTSIEKYKDVLSNYAAISQKSTNIKIIFETTKPKPGKAISRNKFKKINELLKTTIYSIDEEKNKEFWKSKFLSVNMSEDSSDKIPEGQEGEGETKENEEGEEEEEEEKEEEGEGEKKDGKTPSKKTDVPAKAKPLFLIKGKDTITLNLGGELFDVRKPTTDVLGKWEKLEFSEGEKKLFNTIGVTEGFEKSDGYKEQRELIVLGKSEFLKSLTLTQCLNDTKYLLKSECSFMRDYLQTLLEIRQFDRLRAATSILSQIDDFDVQLQMAKEGPGGPRPLTSTGSKKLEYKEDFTVLLEAILAKMKLNPKMLLQYSMLSPQDLADIFGIPYDTEAADRDFTSLLDRLVDINRPIVIPQRFFLADMIGLFGALNL